MTGRLTLAMVAAAVLTVAGLGIGPANPAGAAAPSAAAAFPTLPTLEQQVGQLFMVGISSSSGPTSAELSMLRSYRVGNVMLAGRSTAGVARTAATSAVLRGVTTQGRIRPFVATDQEGGLVQVLRGPGFSAMPTALSQGALPMDTLRSDARTWGRQLAAAGVNLNLAPVMDTVPPASPTSNQPIGRYYREFGYTPAAVAASGTAFLHGMRDAGVGTTLKHFPGLGRATGNTDVTAGVTDPTTRHDAYLQPFAAGIAAGTAFVMVSTATYPNIDPIHLAAFSPTVLGTVLRGDLGFPGVVISDSLGDTAAVQAFSPAARALAFFGAGGDMLLTGNASQTPSMISAVIAAARANPAFAARIQAAVTRVLAAKTAAGLSPRTTGDFTGDGVADATVFRPATGTWWVRGGPAPVQWGHAADVPLSADFTGDGRADVAVFRPSTRTWYIRGVAPVQWGLPGAQPLSADFTGDGRADFAVYRPSTGTWWIRGVSAVQYGQPGDVPLQGDFTGDGRADVAVFRPSSGTWYLRGGHATAWGTATDIPIPADLTGDGRADIAVFRPSTGVWWVRGLRTFVFGHTGDVPLP
ncbi:MAG: glycoside hydrolase family 3 N-terminal domain-containing protein [Frankiaceae bacterium]